MNTALIVTGVVVLLLLFALRKKSRSSFAWNLLRQVIYLVPRYFA